MRTVIGGKLLGLSLRYNHCLRFVGSVRMVLSSHVIVEAILKGNSGECIKAFLEPMNKMPNLLILCLEENEKHGDHRRDELVEILV